MRAENQTMLIESAQGQETVQAIFTQTFPKEQAVILNCQFERAPEDGKLYYVFAGTADHFMQFRALMADYGVFPVHEIDGHRMNPKTQQQADEAAGTAAPVVDTAPNDTKSTADTGDAPLELSATEGVVVTPAPEGGVDVTPLRSSADANGGQPTPGATGQGGTGTGGDAHDGSGSGSGAASGGGEGGEAAVADPQRTVDGAGVEPDPFAALTGGDPAPAAPPAKEDPFADM